jgi:hypothetical protein
MSLKCIGWSLGHAVFTVFFECSAPERLPSAFLAYCSLVPSSYTREDEINEPENGRRLFKLIHNGMTETEVEILLRPKRFHVVRCRITTLSYTVRYSRWGIAVCYDLSGRVTDKFISRPPQKGKE